MATAAGAVAKTVELAEGLAAELIVDGNAGLDGLGPEVRSCRDLDILLFFDERNLRHGYKVLVEARTRRWAVHEHRGNCTKRRRGGPCAVHLENRTRTRLTT